MTPLEKVEAEIIATVKGVVAERDTYSGLLIAATARIERLEFVLESTRALSEERRLKIEELQAQLDKDWEDREPGI